MAWLQLQLCYICTHFAFEVVDHAFLLTVAGSFVQPNCLVIHTDAFTTKLS